MAALGVNRDYLKKKNRGLVLKLISTKRCSSRIELSRETGLTKTAISAIVNELIEKKYLAEAEREVTGDLGRNPVGLVVAPESPRYAGILIQRGYIEAVLCDMNLKIYKYERVEQDWKDKDGLMNSIYRSLDHMLENENRIIGIGVSSIGPIDIKAGKIVDPGYFDGIQDVEITVPLSERYKLPICFDHDNQSAALVEQLYGNGKDYQDLLMIGIGKGVGCGIIMGGQRYQSNSGYSPEIGHVSIDHHGKKCRCGNTGCLEMYIGSHYVSQKVYEKTGKRIEYSEFCKKEDDPVIREIMEELIDNLAAAVISLLNMFHFEAILLGMDSVYWPDTYVEMLEDQINEKKFSNKNDRTVAKKVSFLEKTQVLGAVCNAINCTFEGELL
ncbi:MAG: ROK family transcriptional regulator [Eubacteriales bacterium]|nr:ROK family transcriptional regulator [Eubacteriales bacterium]